MKNLMNEFKEFINRGNAMSMAIGIIIGGAFQAIINSLVNDIVSPIIGLFVNVDFNFLVLKIGDVEIRYGSFITAIINFILMALVVFIIVKSINDVNDKITKAMKKKEEEEAIATTKKCPFCMSEIDINAKKCPFCTSDLK